MISQNSPIGLPQGECPVCGSQDVTISHIKTCKKLTAADPSELDKIRRMQWGDDWAYSRPLVSFDRFADWRVD